MKKTLKSISVKFPDKIGLSCYNRSCIRSRGQSVILFGQSSKIGQFCPEIGQSGNPVCHPEFFRRDIISAENLKEVVESRNDIAVAILRRPLPFKKDILQPIKLLQDGVSSNTRLIVAGWGLTGGTAALCAKLLLPDLQILIF